MDDDVGARAAGDDRFYVKSLTLENFRCFEKTELGPFDPHFNLLVGTNGSGKSSVLLALASLFRQLAVKSSLPEILALGRTDLNRAHVHRLEYLIENVFWRTQAEFSWQHEPLTAEEVFRLFPIPDSQLIVKFASNERSVADLNASLHSKPFALKSELLAFYDVRRQFKDSPPIDRSGGASNREQAYFNWQNAGVSSVALREWFKDQTGADLQLQQRARNTSLGEETPPTISALSLVREAVSRCVEGASRVEYDFAIQDIAIQFGNGALRPFSSLSDGQRALIGMVADIARRACLVNFERFGAETLERTTGLVLIDEIDLHLHPKWQRHIVGALKRIFPKIQFFATTHSPQVIGEARPEEIVLLTANGTQKRPPASYGMDSNWILECVMEAEGRDPEIAQEIKRLYDAIEDGEFEAARKLIKKLRREVGNFGDVEAAESYIWRAEHEGDEAAE